MARAYGFGLGIQRLGVWASIADAVQGLGYRVYVGFRV